MRILVNHLTRMQPGYVCVAGIDLATGGHVRPVLYGSRLTTGVLRRNGGPFGMGWIVDLGFTRHIGRAPELEDHLFSPDRATCLRAPDRSGYWAALEDVAQPTLASIFGACLKQRESSCTVEVGTGRASLGCLVPPEPPSLYLDRAGRVRIALSDGEFSANLSVTDLRFYGPDLRTPRKTLVGRVARRIGDGEDVILSVGLTRPWKKEGDVSSRHWLQVNNINLRGEPEPG